MTFSCRVFIRHQRSENSLSTTQNSATKFHSFLERALLFHNNSPATLHCSSATTILNENPVVQTKINLKKIRLMFFKFTRMQSVIMYPSMLQADILFTASRMQSVVICLSMLFLAFLAYSCAKRNE